MLTYLTDTETCGFHGVPVTIQWAINEGPINLHHIWKRPIQETIDLIEDMVANRVVFHNARFDWFHLTKIYNMFVLTLEQDRHRLPLEYAAVDWWASAEYFARFGDCLKPAACVDTMLLASKGKYQSLLMNAKPIWVRRVPVGLAGPLMNILEQNTQIPWILFAKRAKPNAPKWSMSDCKDENGDKDIGFKDLKLSFSPSKSLKHLAAFLCDHNVAHKFTDIAYAESPAEEGFAPYAALLSDSDRGWLYDGKPTWPALLEQHIEHWASDSAAQEYAEDDITMLRKLYEYFGSPENDDDSVTACQVASVRLRGFAVDMDGVREQLKNSLAIVGTAQLNVNSSKQVVGFVAQALDSMEQFILADGCDQKVIDEIKKEYILDEQETCTCCEDDGELFEGDDEMGGDDEASVTTVDGVCQRCLGVGSVGPTGKCGDCGGAGKSEELDKKGNPKKCKRCDGSGLSDDRKMPVVLRVEHIELIRQHKKRVELFDKLILARRAYPDFSVIGTKSGRMSGAGGLNFHGVDSSDEVRSLFTLADDGLVLSAGDYSSQELAIAATTMNDADLMRDMESGKSLHGMFAAELFETTYEDIMDSYKANHDERYGKGKSAVYLTLYGGTFETLARNCGVEVGVAERAYNMMVQKYPQMGSTRKAITEQFSSLKTGDDGHHVFKLPERQYIESVFGFRRYFNVEYKIQEMLWNTMKELPDEWRELTLKVQRDRRNKGRIQTICGAVISAMYGACYSIQNQIIRASNNHIIQSTGRHLTVGMQSHVWDKQPQGILPFVMSLMSIHDELAVVSDASEVSSIRDRVAGKVAEQRETVPLTSIEWFTNNKSWAEKGTGEKGEIIGWKPT